MLSDPNEEDTKRLAEQWLVAFELVKRHSGVELDQSHPVHLLAGLRPLRHAGKVHDAWSADDAHERKRRVHLVVR